MRLELALDSVYTLGSLWGLLTAPSVCLPDRSLPPPVPEAIHALGPRVPGEVLAIVDVYVVPMDTERVLANHTVLIADGRITALGPIHQIKVPAGATRIDGRGKYLMPGLGTMHDHETNTGQIKAYTLFQNVAEGITSLGALIRQLQYLPTAPSPRVYRPGMLRSPDGLSSEGRQRWWADTFPPMVAALESAGYDHLVSSYGAGGSESAAAEKRLVFDSVIAAARRAGLPVTVHSHGFPLDALPGLGVVGGSIDHLYSLYGGRTTWEQKDASVLLQETPAIVAAVRRAGVWVTPTLRCIMRDELASEKLRAVKMLQDGGVKLLLARDDRWSPHDELTALVRAGLSPYQALVTGTRHVAEYFGRLDELGTVAVGKRADLLLLEGNPLVDVRYAREPAGVFLDGRWLDRAALDRGLLAFPRTWLDWVVRERGLGGREAGKLGGKAGEGVRARLAALGDSLGSAGIEGAAYERIARRVTAELGALRALLPPEQQRERLDPWARLWMREQARRGYETRVPGVIPLS